MQDDILKKILIFLSSFSKWFLPEILAQVEKDAFIIEKIFNC